MRLLLVMAWRNLGRNRRRTAISVAAVAFAAFCMVAMSSLQSGAYAEMINNSVKMQTGHLQVQAEGYLKDNDINLTVDDPTAIYAATDSISGVVGAVGRIVTGMLAAKGDHSFGALVIGTDALREAKTSILSHLVRQGEFLDPNDPLGVLLGAKLAKNLSAGLGDEIILLGQAIDGSTAATRAKVRGIVDSGQPELDRATVIMNLRPLQELMVMDNRVNHIAILLQDADQIPRVQEQLRNFLAAHSAIDVVLTWQEVSPGLAQGIALDNVSGKFFIFLLLLVVAFGILNTFLMSAFERFREFGILMAIGVRPRTCAGTLIMESQLLLAVGFIIGAAAGFALSWWLAHHGLYIPNTEEIYRQYGLNPIIYSKPTLGIVGRTFVEVWLVTLLVALYPAAKITGFRPAEALREV